MKKILLSFFAMLAFSNTAFADDQLKVENVYLSTTADNTDFVVFFNQDTKSSVSGVNFSIQLPEGVEFVKKGNDPEYKMGTTFDSSPTLNIEDGILKVAMGSDNPIKGTKGTLIAFKIKRSSSFSAADGDVLTGAKIFNASESRNGKVNLLDCTFDIKVTNRVVLDENSPFTPATTGSGINVLVKRTFKANTWSTLFLPFETTTDDLTAALKVSAEYAIFEGWSTDDPTKNININFTTTIEDNYLNAETPYLINVSSEIKEFTLDNVSFGATEYSENPISKRNDDIYTGTGRKKYAYGTMTGTLNLHAMSANEMFLQDNKFFYGREGQNIKGFRATFMFKDPDGNVYLLPDADSTAGTRAMFSLNGQSIGDGTTGINTLSFIPETGKVYSISGTYMGEMEDMNRLPKGVYIVDGKKVVKK